VDQRKWDSLKFVVKQIYYERSLTKSFEAVHKKSVGKGVAQLRQQSQQSIPPCLS
jgi:hypothetical protein